MDSLLRLQPYVLVFRFAFIDVRHHLSSPGLVIIEIPFRKCCLRSLVLMLRQLPNALRSAETQRQEWNIRVDQQISLLELRLIPDIFQTAETLRPSHVLVQTILNHA